MAQIYGQLIRAQLQIAAADVDVGAAVTGLVYFNSSTGLKWHTGSGWKTAVDLDSTQSLAGKTLDATCNVNAGSLPIVSLAKGGLGLDATTITGLVRISSPGGTSAGQITVDDIPDLTVLYSKLDLADGDIPQAKVENLTTDLSAKVAANSAIAPATKTKITYDAKGLVTAGADIESNDLPSELFLKTISSTTTMTGALTLPAGDESEKVGLLTQGMIRYNTELATFEGCDGTEWSAIGGGGGGTVDVINQVGHALVVGNVVYLNGSTYTKAVASAANTAEVVGVVSKVNTADQFELTLSGEVSGLTGLVTGEVYFLSADTAGALTVTEPTVVGHVSLPVGVAASTTSIYVAPKRGYVVGATNARTQIPIANNATTTVQNVAAYEAGELSGWVAISATTPLKLYVTAQFSKNGAGNNYNISYQTSGDAPPVGFLLQVTAAGLIQAVLPSITGFTSASITYGLDVAAIGTSFPLSVDGSNITTGTINAARIPSLDASKIATGVFPVGTFGGGLFVRGENVEIGQGRAENGPAYVDLTSQSSEGDFNARLIRNSGVNADLDLVNIGTGNIKFTANSFEGMRITPQGVQINKNLGAINGIATTNGVSPVNILNFSNRRAGIYLVSIVRTFGSVSDYYTGIFGYTGGVSGTILLRATLANFQLTAGVSGTFVTVQGGTNIWEVAATATHLVE